MKDRDELNMKIAEFVLGTLPADERAALQAQRAEDPELEARILEWEERLSAMTDEVPHVEPTSDLFERIERALDGSTNVVLLRRQVSLWRWSTAITSAAALVLVAVLMLQPQPEQQSFIAVFQHNDQQPAFLLTVDVDRRRLNIQPVTAEAKPDQSYQLWIKADELGPKPRSVGVLGDQFELDQGALSEYAPELLRTATFGISVEPPGGSPTGQPTGPAIHGYLYPASGEQTSR